jgi:hypothetical protein
MIYAQILAGIVINIIQLNDISLVPQFTIGFDSCLEIDNITDNYGNPIGLNWYYDGTTYWPPVTLALINGNIVTNIIQNYEPYIAANSPSIYQYIVDITVSSFPPQIGFSYNGSTFTPSLAYYQDLLEEAAAFGIQLANTFAATNAMTGITQAGLTGAVLAYTDNLYNAMTTGSLYEAITIINAMIADTSSTKTALSPFITNDILYSYLNQIQNWLEIPETPNPGP